MYYNQDYFQTNAKGQTTFSTDPCVSLICSNCNQVKGQGMKPQIKT